VGGVGSACHHSTVPAPAATPTTKATGAAARCRHLAGTDGNNGGRDGPPCSVSDGPSVVPSSGSRTFERYAVRRGPAARGARRRSPSRALRLGARRVIPLVTRCYVHYSVVATTQQCTGRRGSAPDSVLQEPDLWRRPCRSGLLDMGHDPDSV
jgi:hypothetical protein